MAQSKQIVPACVTSDKLSRNVANHVSATRLALCESDDGLEPLPDGRVVAELTRCIALCRPVGMTDMNVDNWLNVAADEVAEVPADLLLEACTIARRNCTHPREIVPRIFAEIGEVWDDRKRRAVARRESPGRPPLPLQPVLPLPAPPQQPMTQAEVDALPGNLVRLGITMGYLVHDETGHLRVAPEVGA